MFLDPNDSTPRNDEEKTPPAASPEEPEKVDAVAKSEAYDQVDDEDDFLDPVLVPLCDALRNMKIYPGHCWNPATDTVGINFLSLEDAASFLEAVANCGLVTDGPYEHAYEAWKDRLQNLWKYKIRVRDHISFDGYHAADDSEEKHKTPPGLEYSLDVYFPCADLPLILKCLADHKWPA